MKTIGSPKRYYKGVFAGSSFHAAACTTILFFIKLEEGIIIVLFIIFIRLLDRSTNTGMNYLPLSSRQVSIIPGMITAICNVDAQPFWTSISLENRQLPWRITDPGADFDP